MGLIMLILVGTMPIVYALNRSVPPEQIPRVAALAQVTGQQLIGTSQTPLPDSPRNQLLTFMRSGDVTPQVMPALGALLQKIGTQIKQYGSMDNIPAQLVANTRNDMYRPPKASSS